MNYVIGSGPAGVAAAVTLVEQGLPVTMLDAGGELEPGIQSTMSSMARRPPEAWTAAERDSLKGPLRYNTEGAPLKLAYGSDYVFRDVDALQPVVTQGVDAYRSLCAGGLSAMWGAAVLPYSDTDLEGWPLHAADLRQYYVAALQMTGLAAEQDALSALYPLHIAPTARFNLSAQARFMLERMNTHAAALERQHIHFGRARLAISKPVDPTQAIDSCVHCGMCLYGCPYGLIYSAQTTLQKLTASAAHFRYVPRFVVRRLTERPGCVTIDAVSRDSQAPRQFEAARVYLAAGPLASTAILLASLEAYSRPVLLQQSDHFLLPLVLRGFSGRTSAERLHTLSQLFVEVADRSISSRAVHLQVYTYNDFYARMAQQKLGSVYPLLASVVDRFIDRVVLIKGYLHSTDSASIRATLVRPGEATLRLEAQASPSSQRIIRAIRSLLVRNSTRVGAFPIPFGLRPGLPGSSIHIGGGLPMRRRPVDLETDLLGRPAGLARVHVVDSTVFPTLPAVSPTLTIMANAFRITSLSQGSPQESKCSGERQCPGSGSTRGRPTTGTSSGIS